MYKPKCESPILLFNKYCLTMISNGADLYLDGHKQFVNIQSIPIAKWLKVARLSGEDYIDNSYVTDGYHKEQLFVYVPCNKCVLCRRSKQVDLINRATLESLTWDCPPIFFTLTYNEKFLPHLIYKSFDYPNVCRGNLCYTDVQKFFKRLRTYYDRKGIKHDIRYLVAGEYGKKGRPHYHVILFNNPYGANEMQPYLMELLKEDIFNAWKMCDWYVFNKPENFGQCRGGAASYATKYVTKPCHMPKGTTVKPFVRCSSGLRGGLGSIFFQDFVDYLRDNPSINYLEYVNKKGCMQTMYLSKTFSHKVWKSPSASVPAKQRMLYKQLCEVVSSLYSIGGITLHDAEEITNILRPSSYVRNLFSPKLSAIHDGLCQVVQRVSLSKVLDRLAFELSECVDTNYLIDKYYLHKSFFVQPSFQGLAQFRASVLEKLAVTLDKTSL